MAKSSPLSLALNSALKADLAASERVDWLFRKAFLSLKDANAPLNAQWRESAFPLSVAFEARHEPLILALLDFGADWRLLHPFRDDDPIAAAAQFSLPVLRRLADAGAPLDAPGRPFSSSMALHEAARLARTESLSFLLSRGLDPTTARMRRPEALSAEGSAAPASPGKACSAGISPLHALSLPGSKDMDATLACGRALVAAGADLAHADRDGLTALHFAYANGLVRLAEELLALGSPWTISEEGLSPLSLAESCCRGAASDLEEWPVRATSRGLMRGRFALERLRALPALMERSDLAREVFSSSASGGSAPPPSAGMERATQKGPSRL